ncbi:MAG: hypothetical protein FWH27_01180 [Planctomycetaceae bacterium]|nr:hypothetical protein [Planctomycetaceae bacterium]
MAFATRSGFAQRSDFLRIEPATSQNPTVPGENSVQVTTSQTVTPSSQNYLIDEWYQFETAAIGPLLTPREQKYIDRLIELGLTGLADFYCRKQIASDSVTTAQKAGYARALMQAKKQDLCNAAPQNLPLVWVQLTQICDDADARFADTPFVPMIRLQQINVQLAYSALLLHDANATHAVSLQAADQLAETLVIINVERERVSQRIASQPTSPAMSPETAMQMTLAQLFRLQQAVALRWLAQCQPGQQDERITQALAILRPMFAPDPRIGKLATFATFEAIACYRVTRQYDEAVSLAERLRNNDFLTSHQRSQLVATELLLAVDLRDETRVHAALQTIEAALSLQQQTGINVAELLLAELQAYLFFWKRNIETQSSLPQIAGTTTAPNLPECRRRVLEITQRLECDCAPYWHWRAGRIMVAESRFFGNDPVFVELRADALAREGQIDDAVELYDRLAAATDESNPAESFRMAKKAADLLTTDVEMKSREQTVIGRYRALAMSHSKHRDAIDAHLAAVYYAARRLQTGDETRLDDYLSLLQEHYLTWPNSKQAESLRVQTARLLIHQSQYREAIDAIVMITNSSPAALDAVHLADQCFDLLRLAKADVNAVVENEAVSWFYRRLLNTGGVVVADWNDADAQCLLCMAKYGLLYANVIERNRASNPGVDLSAVYQSVERMLQIGIANYQQASPEWRLSVDSMLLYVLAAQGKITDTTQILQTMRQWDMTQLMAALDHLQQLTDISPTANRQALGEMRLTILQIIEQKLQTADSTHTNPDLPVVTPMDHRKLDVIRADALADTGKSQEAVNLLGQMLRQSPGELELLEPLAKILERQPDTSSRELSLRLWRNVEQRSSARSDAWWDAKEAILRLLIATGQRPEAESMFQMLQILNPELGGPDRKMRFESLFRQR